MRFSLKPLHCRDPALSALYGYLSSAIFRYAEKHTLPPRMHVVNGCGHLLPVDTYIVHVYKCTRSLAGGVAPQGYTRHTEGLHFSAFHIFRCTLSCGRQLQSQWKAQKCNPQCVVCIKRTTCKCIHHIHVYACQPTVINTLMCKKLAASIHHTWW